MRKLKIIFTSLDLIYYLFFLFIIILVVLNYLYLFFLGFYLLLFRKKLKFRVILILGLSFFLYFYLFDLSAKEIKDVVVISKVEKTIYENRNYIRYRGHNYFLDYNNQYEVGDNLYVEGTVKKYPENTIPFGFNSFLYNKSQNIYGVIEIKEIKFIEEKKDNFYLLRNILIERLEDNFQNDPFLRLFIFGENTFSANEKEALSDLNILYLMRLTAINIYFLLTILEYILIHFNLKDKYKNIFIFGLLFVFLYLYEFSAAILRIILLYLIKKMNKKFFLNLRGIEICFLGYIITFILIPFSIYNNYIFVSFLINFFLIFVIDIKKVRLKNKIYEQGIINLIIIPFTKIISILGILFNFIFYSLILYFIFPLSIVSFLHPIIYSYTRIIFDYFSLFVMKLNSLNFIIYLPAMIEPLIFFYYLLLSYFFLNLKKVKYLLILLIPYVVTILKNEYSNGLNVYFLDVGQGDSTVLIENGKVILIDSFNGTIEFLHDMGIYKIDLIIFTHPDSDHILNIKRYREEFLTNNIRINPYDNYPIEGIKTFGGVGDKIGNMKLLFLHPSSKMDNVNDNSLVVLIEYFEFSLLFTGDIGIESEKIIITLYSYIPKITLLKVPHHGSSTSTSKEFIDFIGAKYAVISAGYKNKYKHPHLSTLDTLRNTKIFITNEYGTIIFNFSNGTYDVKSSLKYKKEY
ncbi:MAG: MBL fold metallo-hydrolase [Acholeplasmatales bacterium]|nr:MBL fold metallo-hydrolase [Acholeplasmatales bacterium]